MGGKVSVASLCVFVLKINIGVCPISGAGGMRNPGNRHNPMRLKYPDPSS